MAKKQIVTVNLPDQYIDCMDSLISIGLFNSRSEIVREILKDFLQTEPVLNRDLELTGFWKTMSVKTSEPEVIEL